MRAKSASVTSQFQRNFITQQTFKRNYRYLKSNKTKHQGDVQSVSRRKPFTASTNSYSETIHGKVHNSFINTTIALSQRKSRKQKKKQSNKKIICKKQRPKSFDFNSTIKAQLSFSKLIRGVPMERQTSRQYYHSMENKPCNDQRMFNNFQIKTPSTKNMRNFSHDIGKKLDFANYNTNDVSYETQRLYQSYYFKQTNTKCKFNYKTQKKENERVFFRPKLKQNEPATVLDDAKVKQAFQNSKPNPNSQMPFYMSLGRQLPHQIQLRQMSPLTDYYHNKEGEIQRIKLDFAQRKMRNDMHERRIQLIKKRRQMHPFERQQLCDQKYFQVIGLGRN